MNETVISFYKHMPFIGGIGRNYYDVKLSVIRNGKVDMASRDEIEKVHIGTSAFEMMEDTLEMRCFEKFEVLQAKFYRTPLELTVDDLKEKIKERNYFTDCGVASE